MSANSPEVLDLIVDRARSGSKPNNRHDPYKIGLVVEGGAMRGVVGGGEVTALESLRLVSTFDAMYGASAGVGAIDYFFANQSALGTSIYYHDLVRHFIDIGRIFTNRPVVDINYLAFDIMRDKKTLDYRRILDSPIPLHAYATSATDGYTVDMYPFLDRDHLHQSIAISCLMPFWAAMPSEDNFYLSDGAVATSGIPFEEAAEDGCTHILAMLTRPEGIYKERSIIDKIVKIALQSQGFGLLAERYWSAFDRYNSILNQMESLQFGVTHGPKVQMIRPSLGERKVASFETNAQKLYQGAASGFNATFRAFERYNLPINKEIQLLKP